MKAENYADLKEFWTRYHKEKSVQENYLELASKYYRYEESLKEEKTLFSFIELMKMSRLKNGGELVTFTFNNLSKINQHLGE